MSAEFTSAGELMVEIERLKAERDAWRKLALARGRILVAYRVGALRTPARAIDEALAATRKLQEMGVDVDG